MNVKCLMHTKQYKVFFTLFFFLFLTHSFTSHAAVDGKELFKKNCSSCHKLTGAKLTGPGLKDVMTRVPSEEWMFKWIQNSSALIASGDTYANKIYNENNKTQMTPFTFLTDDEIKAVIEYVKKGPEEEKVDPNQNKIDTGTTTKGDNGSTMLYVLLGLTILFLILINVLSGVKRSLQTLVNEKQGLPAPPELGLWGGIKYWMANNKGLVALGVIVGFLWVSKLGWDALMGVGVYQGYQPEQPIAFSHQVHAGQNGINCVYCHSGAEKGKTAGIPSANVCMNCHKAVQEGKQTGTKEIAKIYAALDYDPNTGKYGSNQKPIRWVKVHNLPDHVYFNHSQHTVAGKVECKTCHGAIDSMTVAKQHSPLTMGWCINCHRETEVQTAESGNGYYEYIHKTYKDKFKGQRITVDKLGGIECAKCHY